MENLLTKNQIKQLLNTLFIYRIEMDFISANKAVQAGGLLNQKVIWFSYETENDIVNTDVFELKDMKTPYSEITETIERFIDTHQINTENVSDKMFNTLDNLTETFYEILVDKDYDLGIRFYHNSTDNISFVIYQAYGFGTTVLGNLSIDNPLEKLTKIKQLIDNQKVGY